MIRKAEVCFIKKGNILTEYEKAKTIWRNNGAKLIWDIKEISKRYKTLVISECYVEKFSKATHVTSLEDGNIHLYCINRERESKFLNKIRDIISYYIKLFFLLNKYRPGYIVSTDIRLLFLILAFCKMRKINFVPNFARAEHLSKFNISLLRLFSVRNIIVAGRHMKKILQDNRVHADISVRIPKYPPEFFKERDLPDFPEFAFTVIFVARLERPKGIFELVEAAIKVLSKYRDIGFIFLGDGSDSDRLYKKIKDSGHEENIRLLGWKEHLEVGAYLSKSDVLVLPTYTEGFTRTWIEGIYMGIPVITTRLEGIEGILEDGKTGILIRKKNINDIVEAILKLYRDPELKQSIRNNLSKLRIDLMNGPELSFKECVERIINKN